MAEARFVLTPFYEIVDTIVPFTRLFVDELEPCSFPERVAGRQIVEFNVLHEHNLLMIESKRQKDPSFDLRAVLRLCKFDDVRRDQYGIVVKDSFPLHLCVDLNHTVVSLPHMLPNDRYGKDGRRFSRPVDLSEGLNENSTVTNQLSISWAQALDDQYFCAVYLVRLRACGELTGLLLSRHVTAVASSLSLIYSHCGNPGADADEDLLLVNTSVNISLNCPVSLGRITIPIRGQSCHHLQCYDFITYLVMNFKKPIWQCPICDKATFFCNLEVDGLILHILKDERSKSVDNIQFNKSGQWRPQKNVPGCTNNDEPYFDISDFIRQSLSNSNNEINLPSESSKENLNEYSLEKYLKLVLNVSRAGELNGNQPEDSKLLLQAPTMPTDNFNNQDMFPKACNTVESASPPLVNNEEDLKLNWLETSSNSSSLQRGFNDLPNPSNECPPTSSPSNDDTVQLEIINVVSMAKKKRKHKGATKRPSAVSSAPTELDSYKKMKLADLQVPQFPRPQSASINMNLPAYNMSHLCKCSSGWICPLHADPQLFTNTLSSNPRPVDLFTRYTNMGAATEPVLPTATSHGIIHTQSALQNRAYELFRAQLMNPSAAYRGAPSQPFTANVSARNVPMHPAMVRGAPTYIPAQDPICHDPLAYPGPDQKIMPPRPLQSYPLTSNMNKLLPSPSFPPSAPQQMNLYPESMDGGARYEPPLYPQNWKMNLSHCGGPPPVSTQPWARGYQQGHLPHSMNTYPVPGPLPATTYDYSYMPPVWPPSHFYNSSHCNASFN